MTPTALILHAPGTNRDGEALRAVQAAGGDAQIVLLSEVKTDQALLARYQWLILPGGFSFGDQLGAGHLWADKLIQIVPAFIEKKRPVLGICNGLQALVWGGWLPGRVALAPNQPSGFLCEWVHLNTAHPCLFTDGLDEPLHCPIAHAEGRVVIDPARPPLVALRYRGTNPNGSTDAIAGLTNADGTVLGLMPHPEDHVLAEQHPSFTRGEDDGRCLGLFRNAVRYAAQVG